MKLGDVLRKERKNKDLSVEEVAKKLGLTTKKYEAMEAGESDAEKWGPVLAQIAIQLETPTSRLLAESGRSEDCKDGQAGKLIRHHRERREKSEEEMVEAISAEISKWELELSLAEYQQVEAGKSPIEKVGPQLLAFAEVIEQPVFNLFYPCGLPFQELDDYP